MTQFGLPQRGDSTDGDRYSTWDAAYVFGSLSSDDRLEFETHMEGCARCRTAVSEVSDIPALLAMLDHDAVAALDTAEPELPLRPEVLQSVIDMVRWRRRRARWLTSAAVGVAAALLAVGVVVAIRPEIVGLQSDTQQVAGQLLPMERVVPTPFSATVTLSSYAWGTRIDMACSYGVWSGSADAPPSNLGMVVVGRDGSHSEVATWLGLSGATALPSGNTPMTKDEIAAIQLVSSESGKVLLETKL